MVSEQLLMELAERFGTPLYIYDLEEVEARYRQLTKALPPCRLLYSLKANPLPAIVATLNELGCGAEVSSIGELSAARQAGVAPESILYTGPGKTLPELVAAFEAGVSWFSAESTLDIQKIRSCGRASGVEPRMIVRINPTAPSSGGLAMSGAATQFGIDEAEFSDTTTRQVCQGSDVVGAHVFYGTQLPNWEAVVSAVGEAVAATMRVAALVGVDLAIADLGGGFPWPFGTSESAPVTPATSSALEDVCEPLIERGVELWFESGRFLAASSGTLATRVIDVKRGSRGKTSVVVDAGINTLGGMSGLGRLLRPRFDVRLLAVHGERRGPGVSQADRTSDLVGPLCTPLDRLTQLREAEAGRMEPGDLVAIDNVGAYGLTGSLVAFLSRPLPVEVAISNGEIADVRRLQFTNGLMSRREERRCFA